MDDGVVQCNGLIHCGMNNCENPVWMNLKQQGGSMFQILNIVERGTTLSVSEGCLRLENKNSSRVLTIQSDRKVCPLYIAVS